MKTYIHKSLLLVLGLVVFLFAQQIQAQKQPEYIDLNYILAKLTFTSRISKSAEQINNELIKEIRERKVDFILVDEKEIEIKKAGGNELLIETIRENLSEAIEKKAEKIQLLYNQYLENYKGNIEQKKIALKAGKEFIEKYGDDADFKPQIEYLKKVLPGFERQVNCCEPHPTSNYHKFDQAFKDKKWSDLFEIGAKILEREPEFVDITLVLASVGFDDLTDSSDHKYLDKTLFYAEKSIELLEKRKISSDLYGAFEYQYKTKKFPDGKANALGWMNYIVGYIKYFHFSQQEQAVSSLYKSITYKSETRERSLIYRLIAEFYLNKLTRLEKQEKRETETFTNETLEPDAKTNALLDRAIDAFARAYFAAKSAPEIDKETLEFIFDELQKLLKMRDKIKSTFDKNKTTFDFDKLISNIIAKPMPDPADEIVPVK